MTDIRTANPQTYNKNLAAALAEKSEIKAPEFALLVKTSAANRRPTEDPEFWTHRAASILRQLYIHQIVGVNRLRTRYGSKKNRGGKPEQFRKSGGNIIRKLLQQLEAAGLVEKTKTPKAGRKLTEEGKEFMEKIADTKRGTK
ncbi:30S ribosomal protein S19e [Candidatus Pacearchaeota archaeon]|nr:30S ribosomal protein S19e [Candidatus Pacearchaeota archaeon]|tara:strand:+ start:538 stop:966 length:429 start_codon:yes stop_codon:yes gene_type:complete